MRKPPAADGFANGSCLCGAVRFSIELPPRWVAHCHCSVCRRAHGAGFVTWVGVGKASFSLLSGREQLAVYKSSRRAIRSFCRRCGSTLFFESEHWANEIHVTLANLEPKPGLEPQAHAYWSSRAPWAVFGAGGLKTLNPPDYTAD